MRVDHRRLNIPMSQQFLDGSNIRTAFEQVCGEGMPEHVGGGIIASVARNVHEGQEPGVTFSADSCPRSRLRAETAPVLARGLIDSTETGTGFPEGRRPMLHPLCVGPERTRMSCTV